MATATGFLLVPVSFLYSSGVSVCGKAPRPNSHDARTPGPMIFMLDKRQIEELVAEHGDQVSVGRSIRELIADGELPRLEGRDRA